MLPLKKLLIGDAPLFSEDGDAKGAECSPPVESAIEWPRSLIVSVIIGVCK